MLTAYCRRNTSYASSADPRVCFGLGSATAVDRIDVTWPSGLQETVKLPAGGPIEADGFLTVTEGKGAERQGRP
jgi:hypothetical protein